MSAPVRFRYSWKIHAAKYLLVASVIGAYLIPPALVIGVVLALLAVAS